MTDWNSILTLLAQQDRQPESPLTVMLLPLLVIGVLWYFLLFRPQSAERRKHTEMLNALKKNDRVVTIGGIIGSVANISADGTEITLKVDDNTRIKFRRSAIQTVLKDDADSGKSET